MVTIVSNTDRVQPFSVSVLADQLLTKATSTAFLMLNDTDTFSKVPFSRNIIMLSFV